MIKTVLSTIAPKVLVADQKNLMFTVGGRTQFYAFYDGSKHQVQFNVVLDPNSYLAIGFGESFVNTDVVFWGANGTFGIQEDMFATNPNQIYEDAKNAYNTTFEVLEDGSVYFTTLRDLDSLPGNFVIPLDQ
jgi:hypothetical protein